MCVDSCAAFYLFEREREQGLGRKRAVRLSRTALSGLVASELEAQANLHGPGECSRVIEKRASNSGNVGLRNTGMRVANQIRTGACSHAIGHTSVIAKVCAVRNAERLAGLGDGDA